MAAMRRGFTLVEMLVATAVFLLGFTACFALFLGGVRFRTRADDLTRLGLAASSLVQEIALSSGGSAGTAAAPSAYIGSGRPGDEAGASTFPDLALHPYAGSPGIWYRVLRCTDLHGTDQDTTPTLHLDLLVLVHPGDGTDLTLSEVLRRTGVRHREPQDQALALAELEARGLALRITTALVRQPAWQP